MNACTGAITLLLSVTMLSACGRRGVTFADADRFSIEVEVISPAMLRIDDRDVRLAGVSAPEAAPGARCWAEALLAREAMQMLRRHTDDVIDLQIIPREDNSRIARVVVDGRDLSRLLLTEGFAASTEAGWDWCGPIRLKAARAPKLGYRVEPAPTGTASQTDVRQGQTEADR